VQSHPATERAEEPQTTSTVLMIRPARFGANPETAATNAFQRARTPAEPEVLARARREFDELVSALRANGVEVVVVDDTPEPEKPDAVFPNNWVSFHADGTAVLYPMLAPSRRREVRLEVLDELERRGAFRRRRLVDLRAASEAGGFLEGTGSLVLDRVARVAYACLSPRTSRELLARFERELGYEAVAFHAFDARGIAIYHTNVMMAVGSSVAVACLEAIRAPVERRTVEERLAASGRELLPLALAQLDEFAGNLLELRSRSGEALFVLSRRARRALRPDQLAALGRHGRLVSAELETIETHGGGSARCMIAEVF
jgi:hypothetical protein